MAGSKGDFAEKQVLDCYFGGATITPPSTLYIALSTAAYSDAATGASMTEVSGGSYARVAVTNNSTNWPNASGTNPTVKSNGTAINFPTATGSWGTVLSFYVVDSASGAGNVLYGADLTASKAIGSGDTATFASTALQIQED